MGIQGNPQSMFDNLYTNRQGQLQTAPVMARDTMTGQMGQVSPTGTPMTEQIRLMMSRLSPTQTATLPDMRDFIERPVYDNFGRMVSPGGINHQAFNTSMGTYDNMMRNLMQSMQGQTNANVTSRGNELTFMPAMMNAETARRTQEAGVSLQNQQRQMIQSLVASGTPYAQAERAVMESQAFQPRNPNSNATSTPPQRSLTSQLDDVATSVLRTHGTPDPNKPNNWRPPTDSKKITEAITDYILQAQGAGLLSTNPGEVLRRVNAEFGAGALDKWATKSFGAGRLAGEDTPHETALQHLARLIRARNVTAPGFTGNWQEGGLGNQLLTIGSGGYLRNRQMFRGAPNLSSLFSTTPPLPR